MPDLSTNFFDPRIWIITEMKQMIISSQELRNTPRDIVDTSHRAKEDYISSGRSKSDRFHLIPLEEQNVLKRDQQAEQGFRDISHWPDQLAPIRKLERILPSIEENVQDPKYRHDKTNSSGECSPRYLNDHPSSNRGIQGRPRIIKLNKEMNIERSRLDALALMSPEEKQHLSHDNRQGGTIFVPLRTRTMADIHQQHIQSEAFPREERVVYLRPVDAQRSEKQVPRPMPQYQIDDMGYQRQILDDPQTRFMHHEQSQASILSASSREQVHDFLRPAIREERFSSPFSKSRDANKHVSLSHIPFTSHGSSRHSDVYLASDVRFLGAVEGVEKTLILPEKRIDRFQNSSEPNYRRVCIEKDENFNEVDRLNRKSRNNQIQVPVYERSRTGIFIRRIHDGQQVSSDNTSHYQPEPRLHQNMVSFPVQNSEEVIYHNNLDIPQNHLLTMQAGKVNPMQSLPRSYDNPRYVSVYLASPREDMYLDHDDLTNAATDKILTRKILVTHVPERCHRRI